MDWEILRAGWKAWRKHPATAIPFLFHGMTISAISLLMILGVVYIISPELPELVLSGRIFDEGHKEIIGEILRRYVDNIDFLFEILVALMVVITLISAAFKAWWIKLCSEALEDKANLFKAFQHAKSSFVPLVKYEFIYILFIAAIFYPVVGVIRDFASNVGSNYENMLYYAMLFIFWAIVGLIVLVTIQFLFTFVPYAIVIDREGTISGIKRGIWVLRKNFTDTVIMWLLVGAASMALEVLFQPFRLLGAWGAIAGTIVVTFLGWIVVMPITTCWWVELYRRGSQKEM